MPPIPAGEQEPGLQLRLVEGVSVRLQRFEDLRQQERHVLAVPVPLRLRRSGFNFLFEAPLAPNRTYVVEVASQALSQPASYTFRTVEAAPLPSELGFVELSDQQSRTSEGSTCGPGGRSVWIPMSLRLSPSADPWRDALVVRFFVDDQPVPDTDFGDSLAWSFGRRLGKELQRDAFLACGDFPGLDPSISNIQVGARIPGAWSGTPLSA
ncbi:MAG: hypothetical protein AAGD10_21225 [Myxococcota bacterium]